MDPTFALRLPPALMKRVGTSAMENGVSRSAAIRAFIGKGLPNLQRGKIKLAVVEELERRVRTVEQELDGERHVSRYMVEQAARNSEVLHAVRPDVGTVRSEVGTVRSEVGAVTARVDQLGGDIASVKAALAMHGRALDVLQQDVRQVRSEVTEIRSEVTEINRKLDILIATPSPRGA